MKKYFILILVLCFNLFGYEYEFYHNIDAIGTASRYRFFTNGTNELEIKLVDSNGIVTYSNSRDIYINSLSYIRNSETNYYINKNEFDSYLKSDLVFLNDFYINQNSIQSLLNYFYNDNSFNNTNYILYDDYILLYNSDGLAVESIVNGVWAGLYSDSEKNQSGYLFSENGDVIYKNGGEVNVLHYWFDMIISKFIGSVSGVFILMGSAISVILVVYFVLVLFKFVLKISVKSLKN